MFKILFMGLLAFLMYRVISPSNKVEGPPPEENKTTEFTDYEEID